MARRRRRNLGLTVPLVTIVTIAAFLTGIQEAQAASQVPLAGTGAPVTGDAPASGIGDVTQAEFVGETDDEADIDAYPGTINDQSLSDGTGHGVSVTSGQKAKSTPAVQHRLRRPEPLPAALRPQRQPVHPGASGPGVVRRQRLRSRSRERRAERLQHRRPVGAAGQHRDQHRRWVPAQREPRRRPELLLRLRAGDQPQHRRPGRRTSPTRRASTTPRRSGSSSSS